MTIEIVSCALPHDGNLWRREFFVRRYDTVEKDGSSRDESVRDANLAMKIVENLGFTDGDKGFGFIAGEPPADAVPIISAYLIVTDSRKNHAHYVMDYRRHAFGGQWDMPCEEMMLNVIRPIKKILKDSRKELKK